MGHLPSSAAPNDQALLLVVALKVALKNYGWLERTYPETLYSKMLRDASVIERGTSTTYLVLHYESKPATTKAQSVGSDSF